MTLAPDDPGVALAAAARNLLCECGGLAPGDRVMICQEDARLGWYDSQVARAVAQEAERLGMEVRLSQAPAPGERGDGVSCRDREDSSARTGATNIVYFARIGDQDRFAETGTSGRRIMVYARNMPDLTSAFGQVPHQAMRAFKSAVDGVLTRARHIEITCPAGTRISGAVERGSTMPQDTTTRRFPLGVPAPVGAAAFSGRVALYGALTPTGNRAYHPAVLSLDTPLFAQVERGRITGFDGPADEVSKVIAHYEALADRFGLDPFVVHSWHAGLHPGCPYFDPAETTHDYWSNTVFSNPRLLHFHTCGTQAPGEISWNVVDASVEVDGVPLWEVGRLRPRNFAALALCLEAYPDLAELFAQ